MSGKRLFFLFTAAIVLYYSANAVVCGFAALFLQSVGFGNTEIGVFFAASSVCCILGQTYVGPFLDRHPLFSSKNMLFILAIIAAIAAGPLCLVDYVWIKFICYIVIYSIMLVQCSLFNSFGMEYINAGISLKFSLSRGYASLFYALSAYLGGIFTSRFSAGIIFPVFLLLQCLFLLCLYPLKPAKGRGRRSEEREAEAPGGGLFSFLKENPKLLFLFISIFLVYISYSTTFNFQINIIESLGGGSKQLGTSTAIAAIVELPAMALFLPLSRKLSYRRIMCLSCVGFCVKIFGFFMAKTIFQVYLAQGLQFFSYGLFTPASAYYINEILTEGDKIKGQTALGIFTFVLSGLVASPLSGILLDWFTVKTMLGVICAIACAGTAGVFSACTLLPKTAHKIR